MSPPFARVEFATLGATPDPVTVQVIRSEFKHEMLVLRFKDRNLSSRIYRTDMPIRVEWGVYPRYREEFVGYVHHVRPDVDRREDLFPTIEVICVGPTRALRNEDPRNWGTVTVDRVVRQVCDEARLRYDVDPGRRVFSPLMQPSESGWEFLCEIARDEGYHLSSTKTRVHLWDDERRRTELQQVALRFSYLTREVERFSPVTGEMSDRDTEVRQNIATSLSLDGKLSGSSDRIGRVGQARSSALSPTERYGRVRDQAVLSSPADARSRLAADKRSEARVYRATADLSPFPPLRSGDWVVFEDYGDRQSGYWHVDKVTFSLQRGKISSTVDVSRANARDDGRRPVRPGARTAYRPTVSPRLVSGVWVDRSRR